MRRPVVWAWAGAAVALGLALLLFDPRLFTGGDNATYYALAEALATGRGYVDLIAPGHPPHAVYPPGYPAFLVPFYWIFSGSMVGAKVASLGAAAVALWSVWRLAGRDPAVPAWAAAAAVTLVGVYPVFLDYAHWVLSEMTYLAVTLLAIAAFLRSEERADAEETPGDDGPGDADPRVTPTTDDWRGYWMVGLGLALAAFLVRTAGLTLLLAALAHALLNRRWRRAGAAAAFAAVGVAPWLAWTSAHAPATGSYFDQLLASNRQDPLSPPISIGEFLLRSWDNLVYYATTEIPRLFWAGDGVPSLVLVATLFLAGPLLVWGVSRALRTRGAEVWDLHVVLSLGILAAWPWTGDRFFLTIAPFVWLYVLIGLDAASRLWTRSATAAVAVSAALAGALTIGAARAVPDQLEVTRAHIGGDRWAGYPAFWVDYFEASEWIGENAPDAVIVARKPSFAWYWSGRPAFVHPFRHQPRRTWELLREKRTTHALYDNLGAAEVYLRPALDLHPEAIEVVHAAPARNVFVLRIAPPSAAETGGP